MLLSASGVVMWAECAKPTVWPWQKWLVACVRVTVRAGDGVVCREASGSGHGSGATLGAAHESAIKEAETDAMKRALITFGNPFGLALYHPELRAARGGGRRIPARHCRLVGGAYA